MTTTQTSEDFALTDRYVWSVDGVVSTGTLARYAHDREQAYYVDVPVSPVRWLVVEDDGSVSSVEADVLVTNSRTDDYSYITYQHQGHIGSYRIDLRA